jgi:hypothetical protein
MINTHPALVSGERIVFTTKKHWAAPVADSRWAILMVLGSFVLTWIQPDSSGPLLGFFSRSIELFRLALFFGGAGWIVYNIIAWRSAEYSVTTRRVLGQDGLIHHRAIDTLITSISDVRTVVGLIGHTLGYGNIRIMSASGAIGTDTLSSVRDVEVFKYQILEQKAGSDALGAADSAAGPPTATVPSSPPRDSAMEIIQVLAQLAQLRDTGAITPAEYEAKKMDLLGRL